MQKRKSKLKQLANKVLGYAAPADHEDRARVVDCSHWCGPIYFKLFAEDDEQDGAIFKLSEGGRGWRDSRAMENVTGFLANCEEKIVGGYHFWRERDYAKQNAKNFWNAIQDIAAATKLEPEDLLDILVLDVEGGTNSNNPAFTMAWKRGDQKRFADHIIDTLEYIKEFSSKLPWMYINNSDYTGNLRSDSRLKKYPLWIAWPVPSALNPLSPAPWTMWQYSWAGKVTWSSSSVDMNVFNGDVADLHEFVGRTPKPPEPPIEQPSTDWNDALDEVIHFAEGAKHGNS